MNITLLDKIRGVINYGCKILSNCGGPYRRVVVDGADESCTMNRNSLPISPFAAPRRVLVSYEGEKKFHTVIIARSYNEINNIVGEIIENPNRYTKKTFGNFEKFIDKIHLVTCDNAEIVITDMLNTLIQYNTAIQIADLALLHKEVPVSVKTIKITYFDNMVPTVLELDFNRHRCHNVDALHTILANA